MTAATSIPITRQQASDRKAGAIRAAVSGATAIATENASSRLATVEDAVIFDQFISDPQIYAPVYTLPRPLTIDTVRDFIADHEKQRERGSGLLFLNFDDQGKIGGYSNICVWPEWAAGELGGAVHPDRQGKRRGVEGARLSFDWMFESLGLDLICETASLDNHRTAHLLDGLGFRRMGEIVSHRDDGTTRPSLVWEISRTEWNQKANRS